MNWIDIILGIILLLFVIRGILRGLFKEGFGLAGVIIGLIAGVNHYQYLGMALYNQPIFLSSKMSNIIAFIIIFGGIAVLGTVAGILLHDISLRYPTIRGIKEGGGFILGFLEGALVCSIILTFLSISPLSLKLNKWSEGSILKPYLMKVGPFVYDGIVSLTPGKAKKFMEKLNLLELEYPTTNVVD